MARVYHRDKRGRFAPKGYTGQTSGRGSRLTATGQRAGGGVKAKAAARSGILRPGKRRATPPAGPAAANGIRGVRRSRGAANTIRKAKLGGPGRMERRLDKIGENISSAFGNLRRAQAISFKMQRQSARNALNGRPFDREIERQAGGLDAALKAVRRRQTRAFQVQNGRNPQVGSRALFQYQPQIRSLTAEIGNRRQGFRRKPMTPKQAARAAQTRFKADQRRLERALTADVRQEAAARRAAAPKPKARRPRRRKA